MSKKSEQPEDADLKGQLSDLIGRVKTLETTVKLLESQVEGLKGRQAGTIPEAAVTSTVDLADPEGSVLKVRLLRNYHDGTHGKIEAGTMLLNVPRAVAQSLQDADAGRIQAEV